MTFAVRFNTPTDNGGTPAPAAAPTAPAAAPPLVTETDLRAINMVDSGMVTPSFPVAVADPPTSGLPATPPAENAAPAAPAPTPQLTPMQAALQLLNSASPESQKAGKELLDRIMANPQNTAAPAPKPELPPAPDWKAREEQIRIDALNYFNDIYKQPVIEDGKQLLDEKGKPLFNYPDPARIVWQVDTEVERRIRKEQDAYNQKVNEAQTQFTEKQRAQELQVQWSNALNGTVKNTLLSTIFELVPDARTKTPQGQDGVKSDVFKKYERVARGIAKEIADSIDYDNPRYAGPNGLNAVMFDVAQGVRSELASILPAGTTQVAPAAQVAPPFVAKPTPPPSTGAPLTPTAYQPPTPATGKKSWEQPLRPKERAEIGLRQRLIETTGGMSVPALG